MRAKKIVILGPDGSGKSTVIDGLKDCIQNSEIKFCHLKPNVIPKLSFFKTLKKDRKSLVVTNPHSISKKSVFSSLLRYLYYLMDYWLGDLLFNQYDYIIYDRYIYDTFLDSKRYNYKLPVWFIKLGSKLVRKPDIIFCLVGDPLTIYERTKEISLKEVNSIVQRLINFSNEENCVLIDTTVMEKDEVVLVAQKYVESL